MCQVRGEWSVRRVNKFCASCEEKELRVMLEDGRADQVDRMRLMVLGIDVDFWFED